jgi:hypothetical protein
MAQGRFWSRVGQLSDVVFRSLVDLTAGANRMVFESSVYQPSTRTGWDAVVRSGLMGTPVPSRNETDATDKRYSAQNRAAS